MKCFGEKTKNYHCKIVFLDETELLQELQSSTLGQELLDVAFKHLNLLETAYFGLRYLDSTNQTHWLDPNKKAARQLKGTDPFTLYFGVKFYSSDPCKLLEEITRYQFFLQVKQDVLQGRLPVAFDLAAELGAYAVQSELGDYDPRRHQPGYIAEFRIVTHQTQELETRIAELHKTVVGQVPAVAELNYLEKVKWLDMYGVDLHPVLGEDNVEYFLGLTPSGVIVLRNKTKVGNYFWPRITKVYFKRKYFMLRVRDKNNDESTYGFELPSKQACKHLWKCSVEHHAFFRLTQVGTTNSGKSFGLASRFSGRTERQIQSELQEQNRLQPHVTRVASRRYQRRFGQPDGIDSSLKDGSNKEDEKLETQSNLSIPRPIHLPGSIYKSTSMPGSLPVADSPRSTRSAPWEDPRQRGLFSNSTNPSPRSTRSAGHRSNSRHHSHHRSPSVESEESCDSRRKRHHHHRSRRNSDNDSEHSHGSKCSHSHSHQSRKHKDRSDSRNRESGSESEASQKHRHKSRKHKSSSNYELVDSEAQWKEVQRQQKVGQQVKKPQSAVIRDLSASARKSGYVNSGMESESEASYMHRRKHRKHRSRSHSPSENRKGVPDELKKHFEYKLVEPLGMSDEQLKDIPYTKVETEAKVYKMKYSPNTKHKQRTGTNRSTKSNASSDQKIHLPPDDDDGPPPPYTPNPHLGLSMVNNNNNKPCSTSSPASSTRSQTARRNGQANGFHGLDLLPNKFQETLNGSTGQRTMQSSNGNSGDGILAVNGLTHHHHLHLHDHSDSGLGNEGHCSSSGHTSGSHQSSASQSPTHMTSGPVPTPSFAPSVNADGGTSLPQHMKASSNTGKATMNGFGYYGNNHGHYNGNGTLPQGGHFNGHTNANGDGSWYNTAPSYRNHSNQHSSEGHQHGHVGAKPPIPIGNPQYYNQSFAPLARPSATHHYQQSNSGHGYPYGSNSTPRSATGMMLNGIGHPYPSVNQAANHGQIASSPPPPLIPSRPAMQGYDPMMQNSVPQAHGMGGGVMSHYQSRPNQPQLPPSHMAAYHTNSFSHDYNWAPSGGSLKRGMPLPPHLDSNCYSPAEMVRRSENSHEMSTEL